MALKDIWKRGDLAGKTLAQIVGFAGSGKLRDEGDGSREFREYLSHIRLAEIRQRADECLQQDSKFPDSGIALQDIVNEIGRRLGFQVKDGLYQGRQNQIGYDGLWQLPNQKTIVVEVKTTDTYAVKLSTIAKYRHEIINERQDLDDESVSILLVVGRQDTGVWEEQIRGSRHAWDMRVISVDALLKIAEVKEKVEEPTFERIHQVLIPHEFIRLDAIAELVLSTAADSSDEDIVMPEEKSEFTDESKFRSETTPPIKLHDSAILKAEIALKREGKISENFIRRTRTAFSTPGNTCAAICLASKKYEGRGNYYWFSIRPHQKKTLDDSEFSWIIFCCGTTDIMFLIPWRNFLPLLPLLAKTLEADREYWHAHIVQQDGKWEMRTAAGNENKDISQYLLPIHKE